LRWEKPLFSGIDAEDLEAMGGESGQLAPTIVDKKPWRENTGWIAGLDLLLGDRFLV
jgi:hypothetical protein